jgi:hypothetical protein
MFCIPYECVRSGKDIPCLHIKDQERSKNPRLSGNTAACARNTSDGQKQTLELYIATTISRLM